MFQIICSPVPSPALKPEYLFPSFVQESPTETHDLKGNVVKMENKPMNSTCSSPHHTSPQDASRLTDGFKAPHSSRADLTPFSPTSPTDQNTPIISELHLDKVSDKPSAPQTLSLLSVMNLML